MIEELLLMIGVVAVTGLAAWLFLAVEGEPEPSPSIYFVDIDDRSSTQPEQRAPRRRGM